MAKKNKGLKPSGKVIRWNRSFVVLAALLVLVLGIVGTTLAWLTDKTTDLTNTFEYAKVSCEVKEDFDYNTKSNVRVKNTGTTDAYIRATYVVTWQDDNGNVSGQPVQNTDYTISLNETDWIKQGDYWYCTKAIAPGAETPALINECKPVANKAPEGYYLCVEILATAIQSQPAKAMGEAWGYTMNNGTLTPYTSGN